jgi:PAS domain S-box-containing protein
MKDEGFMTAISRPENLVSITNKNGRIEYEIDATAVALSKHANDGIVIGDLYGYISDVNETIVRMLGAADKSELVGKHILEFLAKEEKSRAVQNSLASIMGDQGMTGEYKARLKSGEEVTLEVITTLMKDEQGDKIGFIDFIRRAH